MGFWITGTGKKGEICKDASVYVNSSLKAYLVAPC